MHLSAFKSRWASPNNNHRVEKKEQKKNELKQQNEKQAWLYNKHNQQLRPPKEMKTQKENPHSLCTVNKVI